MKIFTHIPYNSEIKTGNARFHAFIDKWHEDIRSSTDKNVDWRNVFQAANTCTTSSKLTISISDFYIDVYQLTAICKK